ncbi:MAG TPA: MarR family transcriptional regulator [Mycobacteriales bacterium]|nr:MarR family transcriptional regulator [Mycobacteriales bacterium]
MVRQEDAAAEVRRGATRLARRLRAERPDGSLSANKVSVLAYLHKHGSGTPGGVAAAEHQQPQSLTRVFTELEEAGLISRGRSDSDGRQAVLRLTAAGRAALTRDMRHRDAWLAAALGELTETEIELLRLAGRLMDRLADTDTDAVSED